MRIGELQEVRPTFTNMLPTGPHWFDILNYERLPITEPLELDYRPTTRLEESWVRYLLHHATYAFAITFSVNFLLWFFSPGTIFAIVTAVGLLTFVGIIYSSRGRDLLRGLYWLVIVPAAPVVAASFAILLHYPPVEAVLIIAAFYFIYRFSDRVVDHYMQWLLANPRLKNPARSLRLQAWMNRFTLPPDDTASVDGEDPAVSERRKQEFAIHSRYVLRLRLFTAVWTLLVMLGAFGHYLSWRPGFLDQFVPYVALPVVLVPLLIGGFLLGRATLRGGYRHAVQAFDIFVHVASPSLAPGLFESTCGELKHRRVFWAAPAIFLLSLATIPALHYFHVEVGHPATFWKKPFEAMLAERGHDEPMAATTPFFEGFKPDPPPTFKVEDKSIPHRLRSPMTQEDADELARVKKHKMDAWKDKQYRRYMKEVPAGWAFLAVRQMELGNAPYYVSLGLSLLLSAFFPLLVPFALVMFAAGELLVETDYAVDAPDAWEYKNEKPRTDWELRVDRLLGSKNPLEAQHLWLGTHATDDYPVLLHRAILSEHAYVVGDTGSGKTALGVTPIATQLLRQAPTPMVVIDLKGDMALFEAMRREARNGFKWFTNEIGKSTYTFNPFMQGTEETLSLGQWAENFLEALGLSHGEGYGRSYYSRVARFWLRSFLRANPNVRSFKELYEATSHLDTFRSPKDRQDAFELISVLEALSLVEPLNVRPQSRGQGAGASYSKTMLDEAIHMPTVLEQNQVVYFWLPAVVESATAREIAKLALYATLQACRHYTSEHGQPKQCYVVIDEFQRIASSNFKIVLEQARAFGLSAILANQTFADLQTEDADLRSTVETNTRLKLCFSATDIDQQDRIMKGSGETYDYLYGESRSITDSAGTGASSSLSLGAQEIVTPRIPRNELIRVSDDPFRCIVHVARGSGYTQFSGFSFPMRVGFHITPAEYRNRQDTPWPATTDATLLVSREAPEPNESGNVEQRLDEEKVVRETVQPSEAEPDWGAWAEAWFSPVHTH